MLALLASIFLCPCSRIFWQGHVVFDWCHGINLIHVYPPPWPTREFSETSGQKRGTRLPASEASRIFQGLEITFENYCWLARFFISTWTNWAYNQYA